MLQKGWNWNNRTFFVSQARLFLGATCFLRGKSSQISEQRFRHVTSPLRCRGSGIEITKKRRPLPEHHSSHGFNTLSLFPFLLLDLISNILLSCISKTCLFNNYNSNVFSSRSDRHNYPEAGKGREGKLEDAIRKAITYILPRSWNSSMR